MAKPKTPDQEPTPQPLPLPASQASAPVDLSKEQPMSEQAPQPEAPAPSTKPKRWKVKEGCTIYVRNMRFEAGAILPGLSQAEVEEFGRQNVIE